MNSKINRKRHAEGGSIKFIEHCWIHDLLSYFVVSKSTVIKKITKWMHTATTTTAQTNGWISPPHKQCKFSALCWFQIPLFHQQKVRLCFPCLLFFFSLLSSLLNSRSSVLFVCDCISVLVRKPNCQWMKWASFHEPSSFSKSCFSVHGVVQLRLPKKN